MHHICISNILSCFCICRQGIALLHAVLASYKAEETKCSSQSSILPLAAMTFDRKRPERRNKGNEKTFLGDRPFPCYVAIPPAQVIIESQ